ncbi:D-serine dehydratase [Leucoagaricus sp. SymC.cos]|nr:D-serine dehydratase [Leucoagaricus sp. SymC.cos]
MVTQTTTPYHLLLGPSQDLLRSEFVGKTLDTVRTPAFTIDRDVFAKNCAQMHQRATEWGASFRAHLKTHKTTEGTRLQLISKNGQSCAVVVSTLVEAWAVVHSGLVKDGIVKDILYGLPVGVDKIADLSKLWQEIEPQNAVVRLLVDHPDQVKHLEEFERSQALPRRWSVFVKVHGGQNRAGVRPESQEFRGLIRRLFTSPIISIHGFYSHASNSYSSTSLSEASSFLSGEVQIVNKAAEIALTEISGHGDTTHFTRPFVLSIGSTPTAHAASAEARNLLTQVLNGSLELHAEPIAHTETGNYPLLDLQQQHTTLISGPQVAQRVRATVISYYQGRGPRGEDEALIDAGAIAFSKDTGPSGGYGEVVGRPWRLSRISQEHGILSQIQGSEGLREKLEIGSVVEIIGQHACLIAASHPWYYIVDQTVGGGKEIVDVWVPWKGW